MKEKFDSKFVEETIILSHDYVNLLASGETISTVEWDVSVVSGTDASPNAMKSGAVSISGSKVSQKIIGGLVGVTYRQKAKATTSQGQILVLVADIDVVPIP